MFDRRDRARLLLVLRGKRLGFSLAEIRDDLDQTLAELQEVVRQAAEVLAAREATTGG